MTTGTRILLALAAMAMLTFGMYALKDCYGEHRARDFGILTSITACLG